MSCETFIPKKFTPESMELIDYMNSTIALYRNQGYDLSLRQLYYQLVAANVVPNTEQSYKRIGSILSDARLAGLVDWEAIADRGRELVTNNHWDSPGELVRTYSRHFWFDTWDDQPYHVEVMVEKQALEGVLEPVCRKLDVGFTANKGYSSSSAMYAAGKRMGDMLYHGKSVAVIYLGDHDPSGVDMSRDVEDRLKLFAGWTVHEDGQVVESGAYEGEFIVERIALNMDQIRQYKPPPNPTKLTDSRATGYISQFGHTCWELDALQPSTLASLVEQAVGQYREEELWQAALARRDAARDSLIELAAEADKFEVDR